MSTMNHLHATKAWLRVTSGILAVSAMTLTLLRAILLAQGDVDDGTSILDILRLVFPFTLALLFGYVAWKGILPFNHKPDTQ